MWTRDSGVGAMGTTESSKASGLLSVGFSHPGPDPHDVGTLHSHLETSGRKRGGLLEV